MLVGWREGCGVVGVGEEVVGVGEEVVGAASERRKCGGVMGVGVGVLGHG